MHNLPAPAAELRSRRRPTQDFAGHAIDSNGFSWNGREMTGVRDSLVESAT
jgi:hypothetical protein